MEAKVTEEKIGQSYAGVLAVEVDLRLSGILRVLFCELVLNIDSERQCMLTQRFREIVVEPVSSPFFLRGLIVAHVKTVSTYRKPFDIA